MLRLLILLALASPGFCLAAPADLESKMFQLTTASAKVPEIVVEYESEPSEATRAWSTAAQKLMQQWWPAVSQLLATEGVAQPTSFKLRFNNEQKVPGYRTKDGLYVSVAWINQHPDDFGMIIHEMTHAIQDYPRMMTNVSWMVEGIADYVRYWRYEPEKPKRKIDPAKGPRDGYGNTPSFLAWLIYTYDRGTLRKIDTALRAGTFNDDFFAAQLGKPLDELWQQFLRELPWNGVATNTPL